MKKSIIVLGVIWAFLPIFAHASIDFNIKYGSKGQEVTELQEFLIDKGFLNSSATGNFYSLTNKAVIAYQGSQNLPMTGFVGPMTRTKINAELALSTQTATEAEMQETGTTSTPVATISPDTKALQDKLAELQTQMAQLIQDQKTNAEANAQVFGKIAQNTKPAPTPVFNPPTPVDKSQIIITEKFEAGLGNPGENDPASGKYPYGGYGFTITVLDSDGKPNASTVDSTGQLDKIVPIIINFPNDNFGGQIIRNDITNPVGQDYIRYVPTTIGTKTITFTSGNLSTTTIIEVK